MRLDEIAKECCIDREPWDQGCEDWPAKKSGKEWPEREESRVLETTWRKQSNVGCQTCWWVCKGTKRFTSLLWLPGRCLFELFLGCGRNRACWEWVQEKGEKRTNTVGQIVNELSGKWREKWLVGRGHTASVSFLIYIGIRVCQWAWDKFILPSPILRDDGKLEKLCPEISYTLFSLVKLCCHNFSMPFTLTLLYVLMCLHGPHVPSSFWCEGYILEETWTSGQSGTAEPWAGAAQALYAGCPSTLPWNASGPWSFPVSIKFMVSPIPCCEVLSHTQVH